MSKDSGIWLTDFVLSLSFLFFSFFFTECQMTTEAIQNSKNSGCFKVGFIIHRQLSFSSVTPLVLKPGRQEGKNKTVTVRWQGLFSSEADSGLTLPLVENMTAS